MRKHMLKIVMGLLIVLAVISVLAKPLLIEYHLHAYKRTVRPLGIDSSAPDAAHVKESIARYSRSLSALHAMGYLSDYSIPIAQPRPDAQETLAIISAGFFTYGIPATAILERTATNTVLSIVDKSENRTWWRMIARMCLETGGGPPAR